MNKIIFKLNLANVKVAFVLEDKQVINKLIYSHNEEGLTVRSVS